MKLFGILSKQSPGDEATSRLRQQLNAAHRINHVLAEALEDLVKTNEQWNEAVSKVVGRPAGWHDGYLARAREALKAHAEYASAYRGKREGARHDV
ncbi:MAG: hypothetical protein P3W96_006260 [Halomonas sp.]|nr:hypothetical protein [Halomonas sp.]MDM7481605.1 hypothetical protein [Halomonas sp.]